MGRACCTAEASTAVAMKVFMVLALAAGQINSQESGSGHGNMDGMSGSGMEGSGLAPAWGTEWAPAWVDLATAWVVATEWVAPDMVATEWVALDSVENGQGQGMVETG